MGLFRSFRARRLAARAFEAFQDGRWDAAAQALAGVDDLAAGAWAQLALAFYNDERPEEAERAVRKALEIEPRRGEALIFLAELLVETGRGDEAVVAYRRLLSHFPGAALQAHELAKLLVAKGATPEARTVLAPFATHPSNDLRLTLATIHFELGELKQVVSLLGPTVQQMKLELQTSAFYGKARSEMYDSYEQARKLHDEAFAGLHGREQVIEVAAARGDLDARAGVNFKLLGEARMAAPPPWTADVRLRSVEEGRAFGRALIEAGESSRGLCHLGISCLRSGQLGEARRFFERARDENDENFAAYLGLGAAMDLERSRALDGLARLPKAGELPAGLAPVFVDWPSLTADERRVVLAAARPLAGLLRRAAAAGAVARVLPIDARLTDLPEMQDAPEERLSDHRCHEAITGLANARACASKIEDLLQLAGEADSTFAHELAHLAHFHAPEAIDARIEALYERAVAEVHVITEYQAQNSAEFFAVAYTDYLAHTHGLPAAREMDDEGILEDTFALIDELATTPEA